MLDPERWSGWVRGLQRVRIVTDPTASGTLRQVLAPGEAAYVDEDPRSSLSDWLEVMGPVDGWLLEHNAQGRPAVERFEQHRLDNQAWPNWIAAGPGGQFLMSSYASNSGQAVLGLMTGGGRWTRVDAPGMLRGADTITAAYGARHWLAVETSARYGVPRLWIWQSDDGLAWRVLGEMRGLPSDGLGQISIAGSDLGYVMTPFALGNRVLPRKIWYSADGEVWSERPAPIGTDRVVATDIGFYAYSTNLSDRRAGAFSANGWDWSEVDASDLNEVVGVAGSADGLVALGRTGDTVRPWTAQLEQGALIWRQDATGAPAFDDAVVTGISGSSAAIAYGWERDSEASLWWSYDAAGWLRHRLPESFGTIPRVGAAASGGYALVGIGSGPLGLDPVVWASSGSVPLTPEEQPHLAQGGPLSGADCELYTGDLLDMMTNSGLAYATCRGNGDIQVRAFGVPCEQCAGFAPAVHNEARWLAEPEDHRLLHLAPVDSADWGWFDAVLQPGLQPRRSWENAWLSVIGHFDDPLAPSCRQDKEVDELGFGGVAQAMRDCRSRFVVTAVQVER